MDEPTASAEFVAANARGRRILTRYPHALSAAYRKGRIVVELSNGCQFAFPVAQTKGLAGAAASALEQIEVSPSGLGLHWPDLNVDLLVPALLRGALGTRQWMAQIGAKGGAARTQAKTAAARINGRKGGRPRKADRPPV